MKTLLKNNWLKTLIAGLICLIHIVPFYISITVAFKSKTDLSSRWALPKDLYLENFIKAVERADIFSAMKNSLIITIIAVLIITILGAMAAYPLARNRSRLNKTMLNVILAVMMIPPLSILVPLLTFVTRIGGVSTFWGIILVVATYQLPLSIFLYTNFIKTIPMDLDNAASIDGCSSFSIYYKIILPLLKPVTATVIILVGVNIWNDYQFSLYLLQDPEMKVVTLAVANFFAQSSSNFGAASATALMAICPITIMYLFLQQYFVKGMVDSAIK